MPARVFDRPRGQPDARPRPRGTTPRQPPALRPGPPARGSPRAPEPGAARAAPYLPGVTGTLAVLGPFSSSAQLPEELPERVETIAKRGVAVVWIQPVAEKPEKILPSFYSVQKGRGTVVVVQPALVANLAESPRSQLNLVRFCRLALDPQPMPLPGLSP